MRLYLFKLDHQLRQSILNRQYTLPELEKIKEKLNQQIYVRQKGFHRAALLVVGITALLLAMTYAALGDGKVFWFTCAVVAMLIFLALLAGWFAGIGLIKHEFHSAIKKGYPEYAQTLHF